MDEHEEAVDQLEFIELKESLFFDRDRHVMYLLMMYQLLPTPYQTQEINRLTLAYFVISSLHILRALDRIDKEAVIDWVLSLQALPEDEGALENGQFYGFHGSRSSQFHSADNNSKTPNGSHLASTYCALAILKIVGYDLSLIRGETLLKSMKNLKQPDGCFMPIHSGGETDLRFIYCAVAICSMLKNWSGIDREKAKEYIVACQSYDGGFGLIPGAESHGGATYCAVASLALMGFTEDNSLSKNNLSRIIDVPLLLNWSLQKQAVDGGFQGRVNKPSDTCYAFWVGGVLSILGAYRFINKKALREFLLTCQSEVHSVPLNFGMGATLLWVEITTKPEWKSRSLPSFARSYLLYYLGFMTIGTEIRKMVLYGGFSKFPGSLPDLYHAYYGFCAFSMLKEPGLNPLCVELGIADFAAIGM